MLAYASIEWRRWKSGIAGKTILAAGIASFAVLLGGVYQPLYLTIVSVASSLLLGWFLGNSYRPGGDARRIVESYPNSPPKSDAINPAIASDSAGAPGDDVSGGSAVAKIVAGKIAASVAVWAFFLFLLAPSAIFVSILWTLPPLGLFALASYCLALFVAALGLGFLASFALDGGEQLAGLWILILLFVPGLFFAGAENLDPFRHAWELFRSPDEVELMRAKFPRDPSRVGMAQIVPALIYGLGALVAASLSLFASALLIARERNRASRSPSRSDLALPPVSSERPPSEAGGG